MLRMIRGITHGERTVRAAPTPPLRAVGFFDVKACTPLYLGAVANTIAFLLPCLLRITLPQTLNKVGQVEERQSPIAAFDWCRAEERPEVALQLLGAVRVTIAIDKNPAKPKERQCPERMLQRKTGYAGMQTVFEAAVHGAEAPAQPVRMKIAPEMTVRQHLVRAIGVGQKPDIRHLENHGVRGDRGFDARHEVGIALVRFPDRGERRQVGATGLVGEP